MATTCHRCGGKGEVRCPKCHGTGTYGGQPCDVCFTLNPFLLSGSGHIECESCNGRGYFENKEDSLSSSSSYTPTRGKFDEAADGFHSIMEKLLPVGAIIGAILGIFFGFGIGGIGGAIFLAVIGGVIGYIFWIFLGAIIALVIASIPSLIFFAAIIIAIIIVILLWGVGKSEKKYQPLPSSQSTISNTLNKTSDSNKTREADISEKNNRTPSKAPIEEANTSRESDKPSSPSKGKASIQPPKRDW